MARVKRKLKRLRKKQLFAFGIILVELSIILTTCSSLITRENNNQRIELMTYNVENLFDTSHDPGKSDYAYLPQSKKSPSILAKCPDHPHWGKICRRTDWTQKRLEAKIQRLKKAILFNAPPDGPEIIFLQEVENTNVLSLLRQRLGEAYRTQVLIEGPDERGIDTALISKYKLAGSAKLHRIDLPKGDQTRGILQADFVLPDGSTLTAFSIHFPAQGNPTSHRIRSLKTLNQIAKKLPQNRRVVVGGDSNIIAKEAWVWDKITDDQWVDSLDFDIAGAPGSHYYRGHWSFLDIFLFRPNLLPGKGEAGASGGYYVDPDSLRVGKAYPKQFYRNRRGHIVPSAYRHPKYYGVSDHFPIVVDLVRE